MKNPITPLFAATNATAGGASVTMVIPQDCRIVRVKWTLLLFVSLSATQYLVGEFGPFATTTYPGGTGVQPRNFSVCMLGDQDTANLVNGFAICENFLDEMEIPVKSGQVLYLILNSIAGTGYADIRVDFAP